MKELNKFEKALMLFSIFGLYTMLTLDMSLTELKVLTIITMLPITGLLIYHIIDYMIFEYNIYTKKRGVYYGI